MGSKESRDPYSSCGEAARASGNTGKKKECVVVQIFHYTERDTWQNYDQIVVGMLTSF